MGSSSTSTLPPDLKTMKVHELRIALSSRGLDTSGLKASLLERLETALKNSNELPATESPAQASHGEEDLRSSALKQSHEVSGKVDVHTKPPTFLEKDGITEQAKNTPPAELVSKAVSSDSVPPSTSAARPFTDYEIKRRRAERFGTELLVSEDEKRKLRAARFGEGVNNKTIEKMSEAEKMKAHAARFGIIDDEAKKKARVERFGNDGLQMNQKEVEKRKARAARFGAASELESLKASEK